ncbi:hypothetical protein D3C85_400160 [compost metagenome]
MKPPLHYLLKKEPLIKYLSSIYTNIHFLVLNLQSPDALERRTGETINQSKINHPIVVIGTNQINHVKTIFYPLFRSG